MSPRSLARLPTGRLVVARDANILPIIEQIRTAGINSYRWIATKLSERRVLMLRCNSQWTATQISRIIQRPT